MDDEKQPVPTFHNDGGPLLVLPNEALKYWEGSEKPSKGRVVKANFRYDPDLGPTDYDFAIDNAGELANYIEIGDTWGVVLEGGDHISYGGWLGLIEEAPTLVCVYYGEEELVPSLDKSAKDPAGWVSLRPVEIKSDKLLLMHAAGAEPYNIFEANSPVSEVVGIGDAINFSVNPGTYMVQVKLLEEDGTYLFSLVRLYPVPR